MMGWRFQKRMRLFPGVRLNISRKGVSTSVGTTGARVTVGHGKTRATLGMPGTGISHTSVKSHNKPAQRASRRRTLDWLLLLLLVMGLAVAIFGSGAAWAVNKCTGPDGKVSYQEQACPGTGISVGEYMDRRLAQQQSQQTAQRVRQEQEFAARKARVEAEGKEWEARKRATGFKSDDDKLAEAKARCGTRMSEYPTVGMTETHFRTCTVIGVLADVEKINETETASGLARQYVYNTPGLNIRYLYTRNGVVTAIQR